MPVAAQISPLSAVAPSNSASAARNADNYNAFLQLLVTQLKNQDPLKPLDPAQTVTQLATFANVEQATRTNALLLALADNSTLSQASAVVGRTVASADGKITGVVKSVTVDNGSLIANLENGQRLALGSGVTIS